VTDKKVGNRFLDLSGRLFTRWRVTDHFQRRGTRSDIYWLCVCTCPLMTLKWIRSSALMCLNSQSCGCLQRELQSERQIKGEVYSCRQDAVGPKDVSDIWRHIVRRCLNPKHHAYRQYGGRGITICNRWRNSFKEFLADIPPRPSQKHTLHRINNDKGYESGNVQWLTRGEHSVHHHVMLGHKIKRSNRTPGRGNPLALAFSYFYSADASNLPLSPGAGYPMPKFN
jgi:hypothetical protein